MSSSRADERTTALRRRSLVRWVLLGVALAAIGIGAVAFGSPQETETDSTPTSEPTPPPKVACNGQRPEAVEPKTYKRPPPMTLDRRADYWAIVATSCGSIEMDLLEDQSPQTVNNFVFLAEDGFYDGLTFHRIEQNAIIQGGDPTETGRGGAGYSIPDEFPNTPQVYTYGTVGMANEGPRTASSQFFIVVHDPDPDPQEVFETCTASDEVCLERRRASEKDARVDEPAGYRPAYAVFAKVDLADTSTAKALEKIAKQETKLGDDPAIATSPVSKIYIESVEIEKR
ncbi:MAG: peptidylprolyl isomerase [Actinomycetota bacterium]|nr:peptidylprolyl isomerase [Actinomycetota bacterium]